MNSKERWYEDEEFWKDSPFNIDEMERAPKEIDKIEALADINPDKKILDLCCGVGRHSIELAKRGYDVTGVDLTEHYLEKANKKAEDESLDIEFVKEDMRKFKRKKAFDVVLNLFTSFGFFEDEDENMRVLENVYESLRFNGKFIIDVMGKEILARIFKEKDWLETDDGFTLVQRCVEKNWSWMKNRRILITDEGKKEYNISHWVYSAKELKDMLKEVGFSSVEIYGNYDGDPYDEEADRLILIGEK
ncbi:MAG: class I SAM-dependent methyltransferase [Candidatus Thermoplasmatota archaeon]|nr:class I SAM-dependent methyltransferase [Candidatus Thermoplasmatota archaeon]MBS3789450.1 class I SAM-dependent methyltransferase [Candidatus Thermoplasmatota archaeon]